MVAPERDLVLKSPAKNHAIKLAAPDARVAQRQVPHVVTQTVADAADPAENSSDTVGTGVNLRPSASSARVCVNEEAQHALCVSRNSSNNRTIREFRESTR